MLQSNLEINFWDMSCVKISEQNQLKEIMLNRTKKPEESS